MALIKPSGTISDIRGKIGGTVFANSGAGLVMKNLTSPVNRNTIRQNNQRNVIADLQSQWLQLTNHQRGCWDHWLKLFPIKQNNFNKLPINGQQAFIKINTPFRLYGKTIITDPVFTPSSLRPISFTLSTPGPNLWINCSRFTDQAREFLYLFITFPQSPTINNASSRLQILTVLTVNTDTYNIKLIYTAQFGRMPVPGEKLFVEISTIDLSIGTKLFTSKFSHIVV